MTISSAISPIVGEHSSNTQPKVGWSYLLPRGLDLGKLVVSCLIISIRCSHAPLNKYDVVDDIAGWETLTGCSPSRGLRADCWSRSILLLLFPLYERRAGHVAIFHLPPAAPLPTGLASQVASVPCTSCLLAVWSWSRCCSFRGQV